MKTPSAYDLRATGCKYLDLPASLVQRIAAAADPITPCTIIHDGSWRGTGPAWDCSVCRTASRYRVTGAAAAELGRELLSIGTLGEWFRDGVVLHFDCWAPIHGDVTLRFAAGGGERTVTSITCDREIGGRQPCVTASADRVDA